MFNKQYLVLVVIIFIFGANTLNYHFATPPFEAPDAYYHFAVIQHINETGQLPPKDNPEEYAWQQMTYHAPLYYYLSAFLIAPLDTQDFLNHYPRNPHAQVGETRATDNYNFVAHVDYEWQDTELAIHILRFFSTFLGILTLLGIYFITRQIAPHQPQIALLATFSISIIPQFAYMSAIISNDNLVITLSTWGLAILFWMLNTGVNWQKLLLLSIVLACNALTKASGLTLYPVIIVGLVGYGWHNQWRISRWFGYGCIGVVGWLLIAGWWYFSNWQVLGDPFATTAIAEATGQRTGAVDYIGELRGLYFSYWGLFGWFNILPPLSFYWWTTILLVSAGGGILFHAKWHFTKKQAGLVGLLGFHAVLVIGTWGRFNLLVQAGQGRLWFPFISGVAIFLSLGLNQWRSIWLKVIPLGGLAISTILFPILVISPKFAPPPQIPVANWQPRTSSTPIYLREPWQETSCLTLWIPESAQMQTDDKFTVAMITQTQCPLDGFWSFFIHIIDLDQQICDVVDKTGILYQVDTMPGGGNLPLPAFKPAHVVEEYYTLDGSNFIFDESGHYALEFGFYDAGGSFVRMLIENETIENETITIGKCGRDTISIPLFHQ